MDKLANMAQGPGMKILYGNSFSIKNFIQSNKLKIKKRKRKRPQL